MDSKFGFLGSYGTGKTTAIKLLLGLLHPAVGRDSVFGYDIFQDSLEIRAGTGYLPQKLRYYKNMCVVLPGKSFNVLSTYLTRCWAFREVR
jgi:ABC-2 type transport system ATP-binding protein